MPSLLDMLQLNTDPNLAPTASPDMSFMNNPQAKTSEAPSGASAGPDGMPKKGGRGAEMALGILGSLLGVGGQLVFGPDFQGDLGAPFKAGSAYLQQKRQDADLMKLLGSTPQTASLMQAGQSLIQAGGIANNPQVLADPSLPAMFNIPSGQGSGQVPSILPAAGAQPPPGAMPQADPAQLTQQMPQAPQPAMAQSPGVGGNDFLRKLAYYRPDLAEKVITQTVAAQTDPTQQLLRQLSAQQKGLEIANYETPAERRAARAEDRMTILAATDNLIRGRAEESKKDAAAIAAEKLTPKEETAFNDADGLLAQYNTIQQDLSAGNTSSIGLGSLATRGGEYGDRLVQALDPAKAVAFKNMKQANALYQKFISGVAVSEPEARRLASTQLQPTDDPKVQQALLDNLRKKTIEAKLIAAANTAQRMQQSGGQYKMQNAQEVAIYQKIRDQLNKNFKEAIKDPEIQRARALLGIDYGYEGK